MPSKQRGHVFRVSGLPASRSDDELVISLKAAIDDNLEDEEQPRIESRVAIVPCCYDNDERMALAEFYGGVPAFLAELTSNPLGDWQVEMGDDDISFDKHFLGFTQLYTPDPESSVTAE